MCLKLLSSHATLLEKQSSYVDDRSHMYEKACENDFFLQADRSATRCLRWPPSRLRKWDKSA
jgi:hypothetical protein